jgi:hypothetical protein
MTNEKETIVRTVYFTAEAWQIWIDQQAKYKAEWAGSTKPITNIMTMLVNKAITLFYSDNPIEELSHITGIYPKVMNIDKWIEKNWKRIVINPTDRNDEFHLTCDLEFHFDVMVRVEFNAELTVIGISLIKDNSLYILGVELTWKIETLMILADYLN